MKVSVSRHSNILIKILYSGNSRESVQFRNFFFLVNLLFNFYYFFFSFILFGLRNKGILIFFEY